MNTVHYICTVHMGIEERKQREKQERKEVIKKAAKELFLTKGFEATSMRNIAQLAEYSVGTIYLYFKDKNDLLLTLHNDAFGNMMNELLSNEPKETAFENLEALGYNYIKFGFENPELYDLMLVMEAPIESLECNDELWEDGLQALTILENMILECQKEGFFPSKSPSDLAFMIWSFVHGTIVLYSQKRMTMFQETVEENKARIDRAYALFINMLKTIKN